MKTLYTKTIILAALAMLLMLPASAQDDDIYNLMPADREVGSWVKDGPDAVYFDFSLSRILDDNVVKVVREYGFVQLLSQYYVLDQAHVEIRIYQMSSAMDAYGLYSVYADINPETEGQEIVIEDRTIGSTSTINQEMRVISDKEIHLIGDDYFVWIHASEVGHKMDLLMFANKIQLKFKIIGANVEGLQVLERKDKVYGSDRIIGGYNTLDLYFPVGQFDPFLLGEKGVVCLQGDYRLGSGKIFRQLVFEYPDEDMAKTAYKKFADWTDDYALIKRLNYTDSIGSIVAETEDELFLAGFRDKMYLRVFHGFDDLNQLKTVLAGYARRE